MLMTWIDMDSNIDSLVNSVPCKLFALSSSSLFALIPISKRELTFDEGPLATVLWKRRWMTPGSSSMSTASQMKMKIAFRVGCLRAEERVGVERKNEAWSLLSTPPQWRCFRFITCSLHLRTWYFDPKRQTEFLPRPILFYIFPIRI